MLLRQLRDGRCEVENQYTRVVRRDGNPRALAALEETMELRETFEWRGLGWIERSALRLRPEFADWDAEARFELPGRPRRGPEGLPVRRGADRRDQAVGVQGLRDRLHARAPDRHVHGLERGRLRRLLQLRAALAELPGVRPRRRTDELVTLAHGAGGKATRALVEGLFLEELAQPAARAARRRGAARARTARGSRSRPTRTSSSRSFFPGGDIGELAVNGTVNDLAVVGRAAARALRRVRDRGGLRGRRPAAARRVDGAAAADAPASRRHRRHEGGRARQGGRPLRQHRGYRRGRRPASSSAPSACGPATACSSPARSATTGWR